MNDFKVLFAGTPEFARASLAAMVESGLTPTAVLTQPDRPAGRGKKLKASAVKQYALENGIEVLQPASLRDDRIAATLRALEPDVLVVAAYGLILPQEVLDIPGFGCVNVHASLLPRWRGAAPIQAAILAGDEKTGISLMRITAGLDCGPVYSTAELVIGEQETAGELHDRLALLGAETLVANLAAIISGQIEAVPQDEDSATYAPKIGKADAELDWRLSAEELWRRVRAFDPEPGAWFEFRGERIKCWGAIAVDCPDTTSGSVISADRDGIVVACADGALKMTSLQRPGKRRVSAHEFAAQVDPGGHRLP